MIEIKAKASNEVSIQPENMRYVYVRIKMEADDFADMVGSLNTDEQITALDAMNQCLVKEWYNKRYNTEKK